MKKIFLKTLALCIAFSCTSPEKSDEKTLQEKRPIHLEQKVERNSIHKLDYFQVKDFIDLGFHETYSSNFYEDTLFYQNGNIKQVRWGDLTKWMGGENNYSKEGLLQDATYRRMARLMNGIMFEIKANFNYKDNNLSSANLNHIFYLMNSHSSGIIDIHKIKYSLVPKENCVDNEIRKNYDPINLFEIIDSSETVISKNYDNFSKEMKKLFEENDVR